MLKKLKQALDSANSSDADRLAALLDRLDDPLARQTDWTPAVRGGTNFRTHRLAEISPLRLEFKPTFIAFLFCWVFILFGLGALTVMVVAMSDPSTRGPSLLIILPVGLVFCGFGGWFYSVITRPRVFDMQDLWYWRGKRPKGRETVEDCKNSAPLDSVHAIQIIAEYCNGKTPYHSYEINLVLHDATRVNVVDHGNLKHIRKDARKIADLIGVPVWDATG